MPFIEHNGRRVLFIHIPKTGGTSVEKWMESVAPLRLFSVGVPAFSRCTPQHYRAQDVKALLGEGFFDYALTIVRNPYDRIESEYKMRAELAKETYWGRIPSFSHWLEINLETQKRAPYHLDNHLRPQWEFLDNDVKVFRLEDGLSSPIKAIAKKLNVDPPEFVHHELKSEEREIEWSIADELRVNQHYGADFETFGYDIISTRTPES